jgi:hypothetical protein
MKNAIWSHNLINDSYWLSNLNHNRVLILIDIVHIIISVITSSRDSMTKFMAEYAVCRRRLRPNYRHNIGMKVRIDIYIRARCVRVCILIVLNMNSYRPTTVANHLLQLLASVRLKNMFYYFFHVFALFWSASIYSNWWLPRPKPKPKWINMIDGVTVRVGVKVDATVFIKWIPINPPLQTGRVEAV